MRRVGGARSWGVRRTPTASANSWAVRGETVLLVRQETSPEDIRGMQAACGILTARGGMTSHAALVARQMGKVCVAGAGELEIPHGQRVLKVRGRTFHEGDWLSLDGSTELQGKCVGKSYCESQQKVSLDGICAGGGDIGVF